MQTRLRAFVLCLALAGSPALASASDNVQEVLARMDKAAAVFQSMTAHVTQVTHVDVLNDDTTEIGAVTMKKVAPDEVQGKVDFTSPDVKTVTVERRRVQEYLPKINTLRIYDLDKHGAQLDKFFMIGFGTSGTELASNYDVTILGPQHLQLVPKGAEVKHYIVKVELWIPEQGDPYPLREKITEPSRDYILITYSDTQINPPLKPDALQLKPPPGAKIEHPGQ
jgi:outer membrane lipoprotein-sorting protein